MDDQRYIIIEDMSDQTFMRFSTYITAELGIKMPYAKKTMLQARLSKRLRKLKMCSFDDYYDLVFKSKGISAELFNMIDVVTTNKTEFFREAGHYDFLKQNVLPELVKYGWGMRRPLKVWSSACATGEEAYTLAIVLAEFASVYHGFDFNILATDISGEVLRTATAAIYSHEKTEPIPLPQRRKYLLKSRDSNKKLVRISPVLRAKVKFRTLNLLNSSYNITNDFDIIFCRNVFIYFERATQQKVIRRLVHLLNRGGYLFTGHSETLTGLKMPLEQMGLSIYKYPLK